MKKIIIFLLIPLAGLSQKSYKQQRADMRQAQIEADTMHFPSPFEFKYEDTVSLSKFEIYNKCRQWLIVVTHSPARNMQIQDSVAGKIVVTYVQAVTNDNSETITIDMKDGKYRLTIDGYEHRDYQGNEHPLESMKDSEGMRMDKYLIVKLNEATFKSLHDYVHKNDNF